MKSLNHKQSETCKNEVEKLRAFIRMQGLSVDTEDAYCRQVKRYLVFLCGREWQPDATAKSKVEAFLTVEADRDVAA